MPSIFMYKKSQKHIKSIKNVIISKLTRLFIHMFKINRTVSVSV